MFSGQASSLETSGNLLWAGAFSFVLASLSLCTFLFNLEFFLSKMSLRRPGVGIVLKKFSL